MTKCLARCLTLPRAAQLLLAASLGSLAFVLVMQFGFGLEPCVLCLWQRVPYDAAAIIAAILWAWKPYARHSVVLLILLTAIYLTGMGLAVFHTGVEQHWWVGTPGCAVQPLNGTSPDDLRRQLLQMTVPHCDHIAWTFLGLSMANWNIVWSLFLAFFAAATAAKVAEPPKG
ncbi:MAG: disulfide bond formation protein B [Alphaproteobacteria bacterium]|nr:disulfide bond formation protein B [Alphaproteobacteria bacterium]